MQQSSLDIPKYSLIACKFLQSNAIVRVHLIWRMATHSAPAEDNSRQNDCYHCNEFVKSRSFAVDLAVDVDFGTASMLASSVIDH